MVAQYRQQIPLLYLAIVLGYIFRAAIATTTGPMSLTFTPYPPNAISPIGERFTLQCNVWNRQGSRQATVWFKNNIHFATGGELISDGRIIGDPARITMSRGVVADRNLEIDILTIENGQISDTGNYTCQLWTFKTDGLQSDVMFSKSVYFQVGTGFTTVSPAVKPECESSVTLASTGDSVALTCQMGLTDGMTIPSMYWTVAGDDGRVYEAVTSIDSSTNTAKIVLHFVMSPGYDGKSFICHVNQTNGADITSHDTCTMGPFELQRSTTPFSTLTSKPSNTSNVTGPSKSKLLPHPLLVIILIIIAIVALLCCMFFLICYCCCQKSKRGEYRFSSRFSVRREPLKSTPSAAVEANELDMPSSSVALPHRGLSDFESPYYSSIGGPVNETRVHLPLSTNGGTVVDPDNRSGGDGASYTALQKAMDIASAATVRIGERPTPSGADVDEEGYNLVGIGSIQTSKLSLQIQSDHYKSPHSAPGTPSLFGSLKRKLSRTSSTGSKPSTPVTGEVPYYKTLMGPDNEKKTLETPYYLSVFPPGVGEFTADRKSQTPPVKSRRPVHRGPAPWPPR